jgi:predicted amino acid racemase
MMGTDAAEGEIDILNQNAVTLYAEVIEVYDKPSIPTGQVGLNPFGEKVESKDLGIRRRAILALGRQDVNYLHMIPKDENMIIIGQSSDHTVLDITNCIRQYQPGEIAEFSLKYGGILAAYTSEFVEKNYI